MTPIVVRLIAALSALLLLAGCGGDGDASVDATTTPLIPDTPVITEAPAGYNAADVAFAETMVPHHQQAVDLSTTATQRSTNPELIALANQIVATQQPEINILNVFLVQWSENPDARTDPDAGDDPLEPSIQGMVDDATVAKLESLSGAEFDKLWLESMVGQTQGGVDIADDEIANGVNVDAIAVAKAIAAELEPQVAQMKQMLEGMP
ncbi:DUF305 domain-containing protein [Mycobacterium sp. 236(2023)]|uniref:DUF305 domain-containing protein n=1 Tax=Mycobacterium sp. 236(2023) TaxID=3038163 RepID=UPI002415593C|nr:DUF305 domain-containing protein [Mycobacterium sp. 236(2023)]MDG4662990.1 DUF305 domain-containing protein [Mycobacterium sp. 236(2023)]